MLIIRNPTNVFDVNEVHRGTLIYAKHKTWSDPEMGFVVSVTGNKLIVQYPPRIGNVTNHFFVYADEVANGDWEIRYSNDLQVISNHPDGGE